MYGWMGKILRVDLTKGKILKKQLDRKVARGFIGGRGLNTKVLFDEVPAGIDPLGPKNVICLSSGPLTGTHFNLSSRIELSTLSPYSGILGDGNSGGHFPVTLKLAGYDQVIITGRAASPRYLLIEDGSVELRDASDLWGKTTWETTNAIQKEFGREYKVACIGQAGENLVRVASTIFDKYHSAARGSGAVLGSKHLKAIAVRGTEEVEVAKPDRFYELAEEDRNFFLTNEFQREIVGKQGTRYGVVNWYPGYRHFEKYLSTEEIPVGLTPEGLKKYEVGRYACQDCIVHCKDVFEIPEGEYKGERGSGLEYEAIACLGINCGIMEPVPILVMENLCDKYGIDAIALGNTIALAKELYHRGIITNEVTRGFSFDWEDADSQIELIHMTAKRKGFGNKIAEGLYNFAKIIGGGAMKYCYHVKGLSRGVYSPNIYGLSLGEWGPSIYALSHATSTRGADHLRGRSWAEQCPQLFKDIPRIEICAERACLIADLIGRCKCSLNNWPAAVPLVFKYPLWGGVARLLSALTGLEFDPVKIEEITDRVYTLERAFNIKQGITRKHDRLPQRPSTKGTEEGKKELQAHEQMLTEYYKLRGWNVETGIPTRERLEQLGLRYVADELESHIPYPEWDGPLLWPLDKYPRGA
jgi:aldehyde:ferredoxin oxidoreductase